MEILCVMQAPNVYLNTTLSREGVEGGGGGGQ